MSEEQPKILPCNFNNALIEIYQQLNLDNKAKLIDYILQLKEEERQKREQQ